jgi:hypothetical protein
MNSADSKVLLKDVLAIKESFSSNELKKTLRSNSCQSSKKNRRLQEESDRIVAVIPRVLKEEIQSHVKNNKGETEKTIILRALKNFGFSIENDWLVDKRTLR